MRYTIKIPRQSISFDAYDDFDAINKVKNQLSRIKIELYGNNNEDLGELEVCPPYSQAELEFEFDSPEMDEIHRRCNLFNSRVIPCADILRYNSNDCKDNG